MACFHVLIRHDAVPTSHVEKRTEGHGILCLKLKPLLGEHETAAAEWDPGWFAGLICGRSGVGSRDRELLALSMVPRLRNDVPSCAI